MRPHVCVRRPEMYVPPQSRGAVNVEMGHGDQSCLSGQILGQRVGGQKRRNIWFSGTRRQDFLV